MTARESFLSFARGAFRTKTAHDYSDKTTPVARADAVYTYLREQPYYPPHMPDPPSPLSPIWHLLSWCVVALEEHLSEAPKPAPAGRTEFQRAFDEAARRNADPGTYRAWSVDDINYEWARGEALVVSGELHDALFPPGVGSEATLEIYGMASYRELLAARIIKKLDEYRAGKRGEG